MKPLELPVEPGAVAPYGDALAYTRRNADRRDDVAYYVRLARRMGGPVLECGCGNGRVTLPLARAGVRITGVDHSSDMLDDLRARLQNETAEVRGRVTMLAGDIRRLALRGRFSLVIAPYDTFCHLYNRQDVEAFLEGVHRHLRPRGRIVFDVGLAAPEELLALKHYDPMAQVSRHRLDAPSSVELTRRHFHPEEVSVLLANNGFGHVRLTADFLGRELDRRARTMVVSARRV